MSPATLLKPPSRSAASSARIRRAFRAAGYRPDDAGQRLSALLAGPPIAGGATGAVGGVTFLSNLPADSFIMDPAAFQQATERQDIPQASQPFNGFGSSFNVRLQNVGVLALVKCIFTGTLTVGGTGAVTALPGWPYSLFKRVAFNANGQTSMIGARGHTLRARRQRIFRNPAESIESAPAVGTIANNSYPVQFVVDVPISHDMLSGTGWVLAQNPATSLSLDIAIANQADIFNVAAGGTVALTGTLFTEITTFAVGQVNDGSGRMKTLIPDLTVFHGILDNDIPIVSSGVFEAPLIRPAGQLVNYTFNINNGGASEIDPSALTEIQFRYGGNRQPRVYNPPTMLLDKNQADYNGRIKIGGLSYTYLDFEADNPARDVFIPEALVELLAQFTIPNSVTVNAGAKLTYAIENLYPAV